MPRPNNNLYPHLGPEKINPILEHITQAAIDTPTAWQRPIAACIADGNTGDIIATATNYDPRGRRHAEEALLADYPDENAVLFTTVEPCTVREVACHTPCAQLILKSEIINNVFILDRDPNPCITGRGIVSLRKNGINAHLIDNDNLRGRINHEWIERERRLGGYTLQWGDVHTSPKGAQKTIIKDDILPAVIRRHRSVGGQAARLLDVGSADGELTQSVKSLLQAGGNATHTMALDPAMTLAQRGDTSFADELHPTTFKDWHEQNPNQRVDFILASHVAYYFDDPVKELDTIASHLEEDGTLCVILADWRSGKAALLQDAGLINLFNSTYTMDYPRLINADLLAQNLSKHWEVSPVISVPIPVFFPSEAIASERLGFSFRNQPIASDLAAAAIAKNISTDDSGMTRWQRDNVFFTVRHKTSAQ